MTMFTPSTATDHDDPLCCYRNESSRIQIIRIDSAPRLYLERVVLPGQCLCFAAPAEEYLEVFTSEVASALLQDRITCAQLQVSSISTLLAQAALSQHHSEV